MHSNVADVTDVSIEVTSNAQEIIYRLKKLGVTQAKIAADLAVAPSVINNVIHNRATSFVVASYIANMLKSDLHALWPDRYRFKPRQGKSAKQHKESNDLSN
jgi:lambda repressor-like predicted transcriptional regulator